MNRPSPISDRPDATQDAAAPEAARAVVEALEFELTLARRVHARLEAEIERLEREKTAVEAERASLRNRLDERERYLGAILSSSGWRALQALRGLLGRRW